MLTRISREEWMVEPHSKKSREYARLLVKAEPKGLNIDGQALIKWGDLQTEEWRMMLKREKKKGENASR